MFLRLSVPLALLCLCIQPALHATASDSTQSFLIYPEGDTSANPRIPWIAPEPAPDGQGHVMEIDAVFRYQFGAFIGFDDKADSGRLTASVRDNPRHKAHDLITLIDGDRRLSFSVTQKSAGKLPGLTYSENGRIVAQTRLPSALPSSNWSILDLRWDTGSATLMNPAGEPLVIPLPKGFHPTALEVSVQAVDDLTVNGQGTFTLDWENGYVARVSPRAVSTASNAPAHSLIRPLGFDTYVISRDASQRDFPMLEVLNGSSRSHNYAVSFSLQGEVSQTALTWKQQVKVPAQSGKVVAIDFPALLPSDIYHLSISSPDATLEKNDRRKNFLYAEPAGTGPSIPKFGLHDTDRKTFGFWPDTLPINLYHVYARWRYTYGPAWETSNALSSDTPPEELNWNPIIEWALKRPGLTPFVSLQSLPDTNWMRAREYEPARMKSYPWGKIGGFPDLDHYAAFIKTLAARYKGRVPFYEIENEPMAYLGGILPEDYAAIARTTTAAIHETDPAARVFGISGTGNFQSWMEKTFKAGAADGLDGVSIHTYVTPRQPETAMLPQKLAEIRDIMHGTGRPLALLNSETGTYIALREEVDRRISPARLDELVKQGIEPFFKTDGWPNRAVDEHSGAISFIRNATYNFLSGAEYFTFFGWNDEWPIKNWWGVRRQSGFALVSASKDNERTPGLHTLAIAVLTQQLRTARHAEGVTIGESGVTGAIFPTTDGGEVAVLWSVQGTRNILVQNRESAITAVSLFGQEIPVETFGKAGLTRLIVGAEPIYVRSAHAGLHVLPSPVIAIAADVVAPGTLSFTLVNRGSTDWIGQMDFTAPEGWRIQVANKTFMVPTGERKAIRVAYESAPETTIGTHIVEAHVTLPEGQPFAFPIPVKIRPFLTVPFAQAKFDWQKPSGWQAVGPVHDLSNPEQVVIGQAPLLASLQEERYWKGPSELSAKLRFAQDSEALYIYAEVTDANFQPPSRWPGVLGSCVEVFLDQRAPGAGRGTAAYGSGVTQLVVRPTTGDEPPAVHQFTTKQGLIEGITSAGGPLDGRGYWIALRIPLAPASLQNGVGLDIGVNGPPAGGANGRKNQMMLFGTSANSSDASGFGTASFEVR
jgi:hypothetical protein